MNEMVVCAVGNVATQPVYREVQGVASVRFRVAATARYLDRERGEWVDGHTSFFTVWAKRQLAVNVAASVSVGDPVVVQGRLKVRTESRDGQNWVSADIDATSVGHDLARGTSAFLRGAAASADGGNKGEPAWETPPPGPAEPSEALAGT